MTAEIPSSSGDRRIAYAYLSLAVVMLFWAGNSIVGRAVRADIPPFTLGFLRWCVGAAVLLPLCARHLATDRAALLKSWKVVLVLGAVGVAGFNGLLYTSLHYTSASNALLIQAATPAMVLLIDRLLFGQNAPAGRIAGVLLSTIGVLVVVLKADLRLLIHFRAGLGDILMLGAVALWALYTSLLRLRPQTHPTSLMFTTFVIAGLCLAPLAAMEWRAGQRPDMSIEVVAAVLYVAIFTSVIAYLLYNGAVELIGAGRAGQTMSLMPLFGALIAAAILGERLHGYHVAGMALILGGIALTLWLERRREGSR